jgi:hypothetical protein
LGLNDRNTALAQNAVGRDEHLPVWGWAPATTPNNPGGYAQFGAPPLATKKGTIPDSAVTPYAAFLALPVAPRQAMADITSLIKTYPGIYGQDGFADSVDTSTGQIAGRYMAVSQAVILMALDNTLNNYKLTTYAGASAYGARVAPYLEQENFHIQGLGPANPPAQANQQPTTPSTGARRGTDRLRPRRARQPGEARRSNRQIQG